MVFLKKIEKKSKYDFEGRVGSRIKMFSPML
jgi:hypothetical protein